MPKYYCDYCKSYLTHDTMSVRKSHLIGKNHIKFYCNYYESKAKQTGVWKHVNNDDISMKYEITLDYLNKNAPGQKHRGEDQTNNDIQIDIRDESSQNKKTNDSQINDEEDVSKFLPPPPNLVAFPNPPPSIFHMNYQPSLQEHTKQIKPTHFI
ncbi:U1 zinc finger-domain-containing protein [Scheffersomyces amazonensis]|uniref:U1 zinc finger-domain-containing protein n=1 Tax=Scheffersomyces amazonensis TaxID=1078765 RepID=UPI00315D4CDA